MPWQNGEFVTPKETTSSSSQQPEEYVETPAETQETKVHTGKESQPLGKEAVEGHGLVEVDRARKGEPRDISFDEIIYKRIRKSPEAISLAYAVARDIVGLDYEIEYLGKSSGKQRKRDAEIFWEQEFKKPLTHAVVDALFTGEFYTWKNKISPGNIQQKMREVVEKKHDFNYDRSVDIASKAAIRIIDADDEGIFSVRDIRHVPSSTIEHDINRYGDIENYIQRRSGDEDIELDPDKVVHYQFMKLNGGTYAFPVARAVLSEMDIVANVKDFNGIRFDNAGVANKMFKLPEDGPDSKNYQLLKNTVKKYRNNRDKFRDMVLTGEVEVEDMHDMQDMDFKELITHMVQTMAMLWQVPPERAQMQIGDGQGAARSTFGNEGYYNNIYFHGKQIGALINKEVFEEEFNCRIHFKNPNVREEIRKQDLELRRTEVARMRAAMGMYDEEAVADFLDIGEDQRPELDLTDEEFMAAVNELNSAEDKFLSKLDREENEAEAQDRQNKQSAANSSPNTNEEGM